MSETRFTKDHEWVRLDGKTATVGITDHAQQALGDVVYIELPQAGRAVEAGEACAVVESVKAASEVYAPLAGTVTGRNDALADDPRPRQPRPACGRLVLRHRARRHRRVRRADG